MKGMNLHAEEVHTTINKIQMIYNVIIFQNSTRLMILLHLSLLTIEKWNDIWSMILGCDYFLFSGDIWNLNLLMFWNLIVTVLV